MLTFLPRLSSIKRDAGSVGKAIGGRLCENAVLARVGFESTLRCDASGILGRDQYFMTYVIAEPCIDVKDKSCIEECPVDCIYEGERMLYIQPDECVDCGACEPVCPVEAIYYEDDVPGQWQGFKGYNAEFFNELGSPGGASKVGATGKDHPVVLQIQKKPESH
jgi:ferredoxin